MVELGLYIRRNLSYSIRNYSSLVACTLLLYEFLTTLHLEVSLIWSKPLTFPKLVFLVCRYFALSFQTGTLAFFFSMEHRPLARNQCLVWHYFQIFVFHSLLYSVEQVQTKRVDALYSAHHKPLQVLTAFRYISTMLMIYSSVSTLHVMSYDESCLVHDIPWYVTLFGAVAMSNQVILSTLLIYPKIIRVTKRRPAWVAVMTRDALATFSVVGVLLALIIAAAETVAHVMPSAFITILSVSGCRMTSNLLCSAAEQLRDEPPPRCATVYSEGIQLTSFLSLEGNVPSLRHDLRSSVSSSSSHPPSSRPSFHPEMIYESSVP